MKHGGEYQDEYGPAVIGAAQPGAAEDDEPEYPVAVLWMPDPSSKSGWCDRWVKRQKEKAQERKAGFRT